MICWKSYFLYRIAGVDVGTTWNINDYHIVSVAYSERNKDF